jgi:hypothetical protein
MRGYAEKGQPGAPAPLRGFRCRAIARPDKRKRPRRSAAPTTSQNPPVFEGHRFGALLSKHPTFSGKIRWCVILDMIFAPARNSPVSDILRDGNQE